MMGETEQILSVREAAFLADTTEQTIRNWIKSGKLLAEMTHPIGRAAEYAIKLEHLVAIPGLLIDPERLRTLQMPQMADRLDKRLLELERGQAETAAEVAELKRQYAMLVEMAKAAASTPPALPQPAAPSSRVPILNLPVPADEPHYETWMDRSIFLAQHGWSLTVTREWRDKCPMTPREAILRYALDLDEEKARRSPGTGHVITICRDLTCPCHQLFASLSRATADEEQ